MKSRITATIVGAAAVLAGAATVNAQAVTPAGTFGSIPAATFQGTGISNSSMMVGGVGGATIGLTVTPRYTSPAVTNDGAGTYFAQPGQSVGGSNNVGFAGWNFDYYINPNGAASTFKLFVDTDPAVGNSLSSMTALNFTSGYQDSSNLHYFSAFFDPSANGEYSFAIYQYGPYGNVQDHVAINVDVGTVTTPEPSSMALLGTGFVGLAGFVKRRRNA